MRPPHEDRRTRNQPFVCPDRREVTQRRTTGKRNEEWEDIRSPRNSAFGQDEGVDLEVPVPEKTFIGYRPLEHASISRSHCIFWTEGQSTREDLVFTQVLCVHRFIGNFMSGTQENVRDRRIVGGSIAAMTLLGILMIGDGIWHFTLDLIVWGFGIAMASAICMNFFLRVKDVLHIQRNHMAPIIISLNRWVWDRARSLDDLETLLRQYTFHAQKTRSDSARSGNTNAQSIPRPLPINRCLAG